MADPVFYHCPSSCSLASHVGLEVAGIAFEPKLVNLANPEAVQAYRERNPLGTVPALSVGGILLTENMAILSWAAQMRPEAGLMPTEPLAMARCISWMAWFASTVHIARRMVAAPFRFTPDLEAQAHLKEAGFPRFQAAMERLDERYERAPWLLGHEFSVADCYALVFYDWAIRDHFPLVEIPHFTAFKDRMLEVPGVLTALQRERSILLDPPAEAPTPAE